MIKLYGSPRSSASRCYWMLEELGLPYEPVHLDMMNLKEHKSESYLKLNPNGKVPALVDGDFVIYESMAINLYLAEKTQSPLGGLDAGEKGLIYQWSFWSILELQRPAIDWFIQEKFVAVDKKDESVILKSKESITQLMDILEKHLDHRSYLIGDRFTLADLNVASVVSICMGMNMDNYQWKNIQNWFMSIKERPAYLKLLKLRS